MLQHQSAISLMNKDKFQDGPKGQAEKLDYLKNNYYLCKITLINLEFDDEIIR